MESNTKTTFYVLREGSVQEEPWEWADIEAMCESGSFSRDTLIFFPDDNEWKKAGDTDLAAQFPEPVDDADSPEEGEQAELKDQYEEALSRIDENPTDWAAYVDAGTVAMAMDDRDKASYHFQAALEIHPYHPRVAQEARRVLPPQLWRALRKLERADAVWEDLGAWAAYPMARGPLFLAVAAVIFAVVSLIPFVNLLAAPLIYLWLVQTIHAAAHGEKLPPSWTRFIEDPMTLIVMPLVAGLLVSLELLIPFAAIAAGLALAGSGGQAAVMALVAGSPIIIVLVFTINLLYMPAVAMIVGSGDRQLSAANPKRVVQVIVTMEREYFMAIALILGVSAVGGAINFILGFVPFLGTLWSAGFAVYGMLVTGLLLGALYRRHQDQLGD